MPTRRRFLQSSGLAATGALILPHTLYGRSRPASDRLRIGLIGAKGMGFSNLRAQLQADDNTTCTWVCDVDDEVLATRLKDYGGFRQNTPRTTKDYRELLAAADVDVVVIGTPDHWHARMFVDAVDAGKDVYVEKPVANSIAECRAMAAAQERTGRVVQVGQWQRSGEHYARAMEIVRSGQLGDIRMLRCWAYQGWMTPKPKSAPRAAPAGLDYDMWLGPAPKRPYNPNHVHFDFRWFWDYAGGLMTDWGVHEIDIALLAMGASAPRSVVATGVEDSYPGLAYETPDTLQAIYEYDGFTMLWEHALGIDNGPLTREGPNEGIAFVGNDATLILNRGGLRVVDERQFVGWDKYGQGPSKLDAPIEEMRRPEGVDYVTVHNKNFLDCVRANTPDECTTTIQSGAIAAVNAQLGNIAYRLGEKLHWEGDWRTGSFARREEGGLRQNTRANGLLAAEYHNGWKAPVG